MSHSTFPADSDIQAFIVASGVTVPTGFDYTGLGALAQREFELGTGRIPFLKDASDVTRRFDPPGGPAHGSGAGSFTGTFGAYGGGPYLEFAAGLVTATSIVKWITSATPAGTAMVDGTDYLLMPLNAPAEGKPWEGLQILIPTYGGRGSIAVTGKWGYSATIPEDVWQACLALGASHATVSIIESLKTGKIMLKSGDDEVQYRDNLTDLGSTWLGVAKRVISIYKLRTVGI
jgi:hypothetical protein